MANPILLVGRNVLSTSTSISRRRLSKQNKHKFLTIDMKNENSNKQQNTDSYGDEKFIYEDCPKCSRFYAEVDLEYQSCSKCGSDAEKNEWTKPIEPNESDFINYEADILTGHWY